MMRYVLVIGVVLSATLHMHATTNQELFLRANKQYQSGYYDQALCQFTLITHKTSAVLYNMGLCSYQLGNYAHALWAFKQALRMATSRALMDATEHNLEHTYNALGKTVPTTFGAQIVRSVQRLTVGTTILQWQLILLMLMYILVALFVWRQRPRWRTAVLVAGAICCVGVFMVFAVKRTAASVSAAIVVTKELPVCSGPYQDCHAQGTISYADEVTVLKTHKNWCKVRYGTIMGWVPQESILLLTQEM